MVSVILGIFPKPEFEIAAASKNFQQALFETGFVIPLLALNYIVSGAALMFRRTAPLGVAIIAPIILVIFFTNTVLDSAWMWGTAHAAIWLALAWKYRSAFIPMWSFTEIGERP